MTEEMLPIGMYIVMDYVYDKVKEDVTVRKAFVAEEVWRMSRDGAADDVIETIIEIIKSIRGYGGAAIFATQDLYDIMNTAGGKLGYTFVNNAKIKILTHSDSSRELEALQKTIDLTDEEIEKLKIYKRGECLLIANKNHVPMQFVANQMEHDLVTTDRRDLERILHREEGT